MRTVLHYKTNFLNPSETFIHRLISNHVRYKPVALCYNKKSYTDYLNVLEAPKTGFNSLINMLAFHANLSLPFYKSAIKSLKPDIIHAHFGYDGYKLLRIARNSYIPLVISFYGSDVSRLPSEFGWKSRYRTMAVSGAFFIAASDFMKQQLINLGFPEDQIRIIRFGLDTDKLSFKKVNPGTNRFMMVGRFVEKKGFSYAIRAAQILKKQGHDFTIDIYGDGPLKPHLKTLTNQLGLSETIHFQGYQLIDNIIEAHNHHALLIAPSITASDGDMEGLPNTILEAMVKGTPVLATKHAAIPEVISHNNTGFLVDEKKPEAIASVLSDVINKKYDLNALRNRARSLVERDYSVTSMVNQTERLYDQILK